MSHLSLPKLLVRRLRADWKLLATVFFGITVATAVAAGAPVYLKSLDQLDFQASVDRLDSSSLTLLVFGPDTPASEGSLRQLESSLAEAIDARLSSIYVGRERVTKGAMSLLGLPDEPLPQGGGRGVLLSRGFLQSLSTLEEHSRFVEGRMATDESSLGSTGTEVEAVVGSEVAAKFGFKLDDSVGLSPGIGSLEGVVARIVGIIEPDDPTSDFWSVAAPLLAPPPLTEPPPLLVQVDPEEPAVALFVTQAAMLEAIGEPPFVAPIGQGLFTSSGTLVVGLPSRPLPTAGGTGILVRLGYFQSLTDLGPHIRFIEGVEASGEVRETPDGVKLEAIIPTRLATRYGLEPGDEVALSPSLGLEASITVTVTGIFEPSDEDDPYWSFLLSFLSPASPIEQVPGDPEPEEETQLNVGAERAPGVPLGVQPSGRPPLPLFVSEAAMGRAMALAFPGSLARATWFVDVDTQALKELSISEARESIAGFEEDLVRLIPGVDLTAGPISGLTEEGRNSNLLSSIPIRIQMAALVFVVLLFLLMMVFYLVQARESDSAMMRTRGLGALDLLRLYGIEGLVLALAATVVGLLLALGGVALAGTLPSFSDLTGGDALPVRMDLTPLAFASAIGLVSLIIFVTFGVLAASRVRLADRFRSSRPYELPFFQRYFLDVALIAIGGFVFWELDSRGQFVSGGLLKDVEVNETLLLAPVLFLLAAALIFNRLFPMIVRFLSGESLMVVHLLTVASLATVAIGTSVRSYSDDLGLAVGIVALLLGLGIAYWATDRARQLIPQLVGLLVQTALVAGVLLIQTPESGERLFVPYAALLAIVPAQVVFLLLKAVATEVPAWLSVGLWHMSRNPVQYSWLVLLMVLTTGVAVLAATVGETFERGRQDSIRYEVGADLRVRGVEQVTGGVAAVREQTLSQSGASSAVVYRTTGTVSGDRTELLGVKSDEFEAVSWYQSDFSVLSLSGVMRKLSPGSPVSQIEIPEDAASIGLWARPVSLSAPQSLAVVLADPQGETNLLFLGTLSRADWQPLRAAIPPDYGSPLHLASVVTFEPPEGDLPLAGSIQVDSIHVTSGPSGQEIMLEDFEGERAWTTIALSTLRTESDFSVGGDAFDGDRAGLFSFGINSLGGFRGFYPSPTIGPLPVVTNESLGDSVRDKGGDEFVAEIGGRWIPMRIVDTVEYFPTMDPNLPFVISDLEGLQGHLNAFPAEVSTTPNELLIKSSSEGRQRLVDALTALDPGPSEVMDLSSLLESQELDPFTTAAWRPMVFLSIGVGLFAAAAAYIAYLFLFMKRGRVEIGSLESLGLSRGQLMALLGFEHLSISAMGVGLGVWAGFEMRSLIVSPLAVTTAGEQLVPPFVMTTDWGLLAPAFGLLAAFLILGLVALSVRARNVDLSAIARTGDA